MVECDLCHRTGFTDDELDSHQGTEACVEPMSIRERMEHTKSTDDWGGTRLDLPPLSEEQMKALMDYVIARLPVAFDPTAKAKVPGLDPNAPGVKT